MLTCRRRCSRMPWSARPRLWRSTTSRRTLLHISRRSLTRSTIPLGIALWGGILEVMSPTRRSISSTSTWARWPSCCSNLAEKFGDRTLAVNRQQSDSPGMLLSWPRGPAFSLLLYVTTC